MDDAALIEPPYGTWTTPFDPDLVVGVYILALPDRLDAVHYLVYSHVTTSGATFTGETTVCGQDGPFAQPVYPDCELICPCCVDGLSQALDEARKALGFRGYLD